MEDLASMINQVMQNPDAMRQLNQVAASLGLGGTSQPQPEALVPTPQAPDFSSLFPSSQPVLQTQPAQQMPDLSALAAMLQNQNGAQPIQQAQPAQQMPDLSALASMFANQNGTQPMQQAQPAQQMPDLSALASMFANQNGSQPAQQAQPAQQMPDLSGLASMLGNLNGAQTSQPAQQMPDLSGLASLFGGQSGTQSAGKMPPIDMKTIMMLQSAMSAFSQEDANTQFLRSLKPILSDERGKKIDDAVRFMSLMRLLPLVKDSGLFSSK